MYIQELFEDCLYIPVFRANMELLCIYFYPKMDRSYIKGTSHVIIMGSSDIIRVTSDTIKNSSDIIRIIYRLHKIV